jgi:hypothetical protein
MVDMKSRMVAAELIEEFATGRITNDEFDEQYPRSDDRAVQTIGNSMWFFWDDRFTHRLEGKFELTDQQRDLFARFIAFLQTDLEYTGPVVGASVLDRLKSSWKRIVGKEELPSARGDASDPWWPFSSEEQYKRYVPNVNP